MRFWTAPSLFDLSILIALMAAVSLARRALGPAEHRWPLPSAMLAGILGLALGPTATGLLPFHTEAVEVWVYHGLALTFILFGLRRPGTQGLSNNIRSMTFALPLMNLLQAMLGLGFVLVWTGFFTRLHPGFGWMLPLGFSQGPGQALSLGEAFAEQGMADGGQIGLATAAVGFAWSAFAGVFLVAWGRRKGLVRAGSSSVGPQLEIPAFGAILGAAVCALVVYTVTYGTLLGLVRAVGKESDVAPMIWGFHFLVGLLIALTVARALPKQFTQTVTDSVLGRVAGVVVDITTVGAIAAVRLDVLTEYWLPILLLTTMGGVLTLVFAMWHASRTYEEAPFEHAVCFFGTMTGTLPTGLALLRTIDPGLQSSAGKTQTVAGAASIPFSIPLMLIFLPFPTRGWPETYPRTTIIVIGIMIAYSMALTIGWWWVGGLRAGPTPWRIWAEPER